jgi:hypothetical protein
VSYYEAFAEYVRGWAQRREERASETRRTLQRDAAQVFCRLVCGWINREPQWVPRMFAEHLMEFTRLEKRRAESRRESAASRAISAAMADEARQLLRCVRDWICRRALRYRAKGAV